MKAEPRTTEEKIDLIKQFDKLRKKMSRTEACEQMGVKPTDIYNWRSKLVTKEKSPKVVMYKASKASIKQGLKKKSVVVAHSPTQNMTLIIGNSVQIAEVLKGLRHEQ